MQQKHCQTRDKILRNEVVLKWQMFWWDCIAVRLIDTKHDQVIQNCQVGVLSSAAMSISTVHKLAGPSVRLSVCPSVLLFVSYRRLVRPLMSAPPVILCNPDWTWTYPIDVWTCMFNGRVHNINKNHLIDLLNSHICDSTFHFLSLFYLFYLPSDIPF